MIARPIQKLQSMICFESYLITPRNFRIFILVRNHPAALFNASEYVIVGFLMGYFETERKEAAAIANGQMPCGFRSHIKVLVKPISRRAIDAALAPFDFDDLILMPVRVRMDAPLFVPEKHVTNRLQTDDDRSGTVVMGFVIFAHGP